VHRLQDTAAAWLAEHRSAVLVEVTAARGSAPREAGTRMLVAADRCEGTIGGGHLELKAIAQARAMIEAAQSARTTAADVETAERAAVMDAGVSEPAAAGLRAASAGGGRAPLTRPAGCAPQSAHYPLGPALGQCCGGAVSLGFAMLDAATLQAWPAHEPRFHLQLYGAGHVGRAIARALAPLDGVVEWIDERESEFPQHFFEHGGPWPDHIRKVCVDAVDAEVRKAPPGAFYLVLTHQHDLDLQITEAVLRRGDFGFLGLIGSRTKKQRFIHRFEQRGVPAERIARMTCPIGIEGIDGKEPELIAVAVVAQLLQVAALSQARLHTSDALISS
jgi:xanthine dehydrogenase accessory factor